MHWRGDAAHPGTAMIDAIAIFAQPEAWVALATLIVLEVVLGIDNLIFISILSNKLPAADRTRVRRLGISLDQSRARHAVLPVTERCVLACHPAPRPTWLRRRGTSRPSSTAW